MHFCRLAGAAALSILFASPALADDWSKKYAVSGTPEVRVVADDGHVQVNTWERKEIEARVTTRGWRIGEGGVRIEESQTGQQVTLRVLAPRGRWNWGTSYSIQIELMLPREANLRAETGDGHVTVRSLVGNLDVRTGDGHITVSAIRGDIRLRTGDGHVEGDQLDGKLAIQTGDGRIRVAGRFDALDLRSGDGSIDVNAAAASKIVSEWFVRTEDGAVHMRLPRDLRADVEAYTGDGRITFDVPITVSGGLSRSSVRGKLNGGGPPLRVRTGDGSIRIESL